ncbi:MAG TPA: ribonuclease M5, partial [Tissierella sp.]|nr:ribonuclease M5 [Tissierella sp.]
REKRERLGEILGIGYANSKQFLNRLNNFGITRKEFEEALERIEGDHGR